MGNQRTSQAKSAESSGPAVSSTTAESLPLVAPTNNNSLLRLQQSAGNQAVLGLLRAVAARSTPPAGSPSDIHEQQADHAADAVIRSPASVLHRLPPFLKATAAPLLQRRCRECEEEEEEGALRRKEAENGGSQPNHRVDLGGITGRGRPLDDSTRSFFESRFGRDFSQVRVHTDGRAARAARSVNARAFTLGNEIVFGTGEFRPESTTGRHLLAHELAHTIQQAGAVSARAPALQRRTSVGSPHHPLEREADRVADAVMGLPHPSVGSISPDRSATVRRQGIFEGIVETAGGALHAGADWFREKIEQYAPGLLALLREGPLDLLTEKISHGANAVFSGARALFGREGFIATVRETFSTLAGTVGRVIGQLAEGDFSSISGAARGLLDLGEKIAGSAIQKIQDVTSTVGTFFTNLAEKLTFADIAEAIRTVAGDAWEWVEDKARWIWNRTRPLRETFGLSEAWDWLLDRFDLSWGSSGDVLDWLLGWARRAWEHVARFIEPVVSPIRRIAAALGDISPLDPIIAIARGGQLTWEGLRWIVANWNNPDVIVQAREALSERVLPKILAGVGMLQAPLIQAQIWISERVGSLLAPFEGLIESLSASNLLKLAKGAIEFVKQKFDEFASWARQQFVALLARAHEALNKIGEYFSIVWELTKSLLMIALNPTSIPMVFAGLAWRVLPDYFKPGIIDWVVNMLLRFVRRLPEMPSLSLLWPMVKHGLIGFLKHFQELRGEEGVEEKVRISNRVAVIMSGGSVQFALGYAKGLLVGLWEGLIGPFELIWTLIQLIPRAIAFFRNLASRFPEVEKILEGLSDVAQSIQENWQEALTSLLEGDTSIGKIVDFLSGIWEAVTGAFQSVGGAIAGALREQFQQSDFKLGEKVGWVAGTVLFEVLLALVTGGASLAKAPIMALGRLLAGAGRTAAKAFQWLSRIMPKLIDGIRGITSFVKGNRVLGPIVEKLMGVLRAILDFATQGLLRTATEAAAAGRGGAALGREGLEAATREFAEESVETGTEVAAREFAEETVETSVTAAGKGVPERAEPLFPISPSKGHEHAPGSRLPDAESAAAREGVELSTGVAKAREEIQHAVCGFCFPAGTKVLTESGFRNIEDLQPGDLVVAQHEHDRSRKGLKAVIQTFENSTDSLIELSIGSQTIKTTPGHVWWIEGKGWILARQIRVGDAVLTSNNRLRAIDKINKISRFVSTYNCYVEEYHTYFVAGHDDGPAVLVHNASVGARILRPDEIYQLIIPQIVISDRKAIREVIGKSLTSTGSYTTELKGLFAFLRGGGGAGHLAVTGDAIDRLETVMRNITTKGGGVVAAVDLSKVGGRRIFDLRDPRVMQRLLESYPRFEKFFQRLAEEGVVAVRGQIPAKAVRSLVNIPETLSGAEKKILLRDLLTGCGGT